jgi:hypothetical protein
MCKCIHWWALTPILYICHLFALFCAGRCVFQWEPLCLDLRQLVLAKLSVRDLACAALTCREFREAYVCKVAQEQANLIAIGKEICGRRLFSSVVTAFQCAMGGLDLVWEKAGDVWIGADGEVVPEKVARRRSRARHGRRIALIRKGVGCNPLSVVICLNPPRWYGLQFEMYRYFETCVGLKADLSTKKGVAGMAVLVAICAGNAEGPRPHLQSYVTVDVAVGGVSHGSAKGRRLEDLIAPLLSLSELLPLRNPSHPGLIPGLPTTRNVPRISPRSIL